MVVHPAPGHRPGTLVNALLFHMRDLSGVGGRLRPGIVHRLDRDTSGLLVVAKTDEAHLALTDALRQRRVQSHLPGGLLGPPGGVTADGGRPHRAGSPEPSAHGRGRGRTAGGDPGARS